MAFSALMARDRVVYTLLDDIFSLRCISSWVSWSMYLICMALRCTSGSLDIIVSSIAARSSVSAASWAASSSL